MSGKSFSTIPRSTKVCKRVFDLILITPFLIIVTPVLLLLSLGYMITFIFIPEDRGPIFHRVFRKSQGRLFVIYKFRLSRLNALRVQQMSDEMKQKIESLLFP